MSIYEDDAGDADDGSDGDYAGEKTMSMSISIMYQIFGNATWRTSSVKFSLLNFS